MADICSGLTNTLYILPKINIRGVGIKWEIGMSIGIPLTLNQMTLYAIYRNCR